MMQLHLSNDRTEVDMHVLAKAFGLSREAFDDALSVSAISYWYELGPGDTATPRTVFRSTETGQRVTLDRTGRIMSPEESHLVDQPAPCSETCRPVGAKERAVDAATPVDATCASGQSPQQAAARRLDGLLDQALQDTFPASDPVAVSFDAPGPGP